MKFAMQVVVVTLLFGMTSSVMALTPVRNKQAAPISKATDLFCKSVESRNFEMMDNLLGQGADINGVCYFGYNGGRGHVTPLMFTIEAQGVLGGDYTKVIDYLLDHSADVNVRNDNGGTPLILAASLFSRNSEESDRVIPMLIAKGAKLDVVDKAGHVAFDYMAGGAYNPNNFEVWKKNFYLLLGKGVDINHKDNNGTTALIRSASVCGSSSVEMLIGSGANVALKDRKGQTAYDIAMDAAASSRQPGCNNTVRILSNPQDYAKTPAKPSASAAAGTAQTKPQPNLFDALNSLGKTLNQAAR